MLSYKAKDTHMFRSSRGLSHFLPAIVFVASCLFLVLLLFTVKPAVFFSGDGGLKYLATQQVNRQGSPVVLKLKAEDWVSSIRSKGYYPFKPPFVYEQQDQKVISFPPYFQWLSAPLLRHFGATGLYIIPAVSVVLLWLWFVQVLYRLGIRVRVIAAALFSLGFCTPLTLYGAIYWEHTLAVLLLFGGLAFLINPDETRTRAFVTGCLTGFATWLRPEALLLWLLIVALVLYNQTKQHRKTNLYFVTGSFVIGALFFLNNWLLYKNLLGAHGYQLTQEPLFRARLTQSLFLLKYLNTTQLLFFPLEAVVYAMALYAVARKYPLPKPVAQLILLSILFSVTAPFFLPNGGGKQWGPRYLLVLIPIILLAGVLLFQHLAIRGNIFWLLVPCMLYSIYLNCFSGYKTLRNDYTHRVKPCLEQLLQDSCKTIVVQNQFIALEFAALFSSKNIFLAEDAFSYARLQALLLGADQQQWIFVAQDRQLVLPCQPQHRTEPVRHAGDYFFVRCHR